MEKKRESTVVLCSVLFDYVRRIMELSQYKV